MIKSVAFVAGRHLLLFIQHNLDEVKLVIDVLETFCKLIILLNSSDEEIEEVSDVEYDNDEDDIDEVHLK